MEVFVVREKVLKEDRWARQEVNPDEHFEEHTAERERERVPADKQFERQKVCVSYFFFLLPLLLLPSRDGALMTSPYLNYYLLTTSSATVSRSPLNAFPISFLKINSVTLRALLSHISSTISTSITPYETTSTAIAIHTIYIHTYLFVHVL